MPLFCHEVSYTTDAYAALLRNPQNGFDAIRTPIEGLGGKIHASFVASGPFDVLAISEFPSEISTAAISVAFSTGGAVARILTTPLLASAQTVSALVHAAASNYHFDLPPAPSRAASAR
jgi:uncharacterized protein with GYD domain